LGVVFLAGCASVPEAARPWAGVWGSSEITLWLGGGGDFVSREVPLEQTKPSGHTLLKGSWFVDGGILRLNVSQSGIVSGPLPNFTYGKIEPAHFTTELILTKGAKSMLLRHLHLTPFRGDTRRIALKLTRLSPEPAALDWSAVEARIAELALQRPTIVKRVLPSGLKGSKGKIY